jgi:hypothetical protein
MDVHPYDTVCDDTIRHDNCHARMHGLIHDGRYGHAHHVFKGECMFIGLMCAFK